MKQTRNDVGETEKKKEICDDKRVKKTERNEMEKVKRIKAFQNPRRNRVKEHDGGKKKV